MAAIAGEATHRNGRQMDPHLGEGALGFYLVCLPFSVWVCALGLLGAGFLREPADQPRIFRWVARRSGALPERLSWRDVAGLVFVLAVTNFVPFFMIVLEPVRVLMHRPSVGAAWLALALVYFLIHGIWLATVWRAIGRSRSRHSAG